MQIHLESMAPYLVFIISYFLLLYQLKKGCNGEKLWRGDQRY